MTTSIDQLNRARISEGSKSPNEQHGTAKSMGLTHLAQQATQEPNTQRPAAISASRTPSPSSIIAVLHAAKKFLAQQHPLPTQQLNELKNCDCFFSLGFFEDFISTLNVRIKIATTKTRTIENGEIISWFMKEEPNHEIRLYYFVFNAQKKACDLRSLEGSNAYAKFQEFMHNDTFRAVGITHKQYLYMRFLKKRAFALHELEKLESLIKTADAYSITNTAALIKIGKNATTSSLKKALNSTTTRPQSTKARLKLAINNEIIDFFCKKNFLTDEDLHILLNRDISSQQAEQLIPILRKSASSRAQRVAHETTRLLEGWKSTDSTRQISADILLRSALIIEDAVTKYHTVHDRVIRFLPGKKEQEYRPPVRMEFDLVTKKVTLTEKWKFITKKFQGSVKAGRASFDIDLDTATTPATPVAYLQMKSKTISDHKIAALQHEIAFAKQFRGKRGCANLRSVCEASVRTKTQGEKQQYSLVYDKYIDDLHAIVCAGQNCSYFTACEDILYGLDAHEKANVVHCDMKLENILGRLENNTMRGFISDWGFAQQGEALHRSFGNVYGTPEYTDPSMIRNGATVENLFKADLFATGISFDLLIRKADSPWHIFLTNCFNEESNTWLYSHEEIASRLTTAINKHITRTSEEKAAFITKFQQNKLTEGDVLRYMANVLLEPVAEKRLWASEALELFLCLKSHMDVNPRPQAPTITKERVRAMINSLTRGIYVQ